MSLLNTIASYSDAKNYDLEKFTQLAEALFKMLNPRKELLENTEYLENWRKIAIPDLESFCNYVNSINFNFTKKPIQIRIPKINFNFGNITNK